MTAGVASFGPESVSGGWEAPVNRREVSVNEREMSVNVRETWPADTLLLLLPGFCSQLESDGVWVADRPLHLPCCSVPKLQTAVSGGEVHRLNRMLAGCHCKSSSRPQAQSLARR